MYCPCHGKVFNIFKQEGFRLFFSNNPCHIKKKECPESCIRTRVAFPGHFFGNACYAEWLTGEASQQDFMIRNVLLVDFGDITDKHMIRRLREVGQTGFSGKPVPFAAKDTLSPMRLKSHSDPACSCKQVNETQFVVFSGIFSQWQDPVSDHLCKTGWRISFAANCSDINFKNFSQLLLRVALSSCSQQLQWVGLIHNLWLIKRGWLEAVMSAFCPFFKSLMISDEPVLLQESGAGR